MKQEDIFAKLISSRQHYYESVFGKEDTVLQKIQKQAKLEGIEYMQLSPGERSYFTTPHPSCPSEQSCGDWRTLWVLHSPYCPWTCGFRLCLFTGYGF